MKPLPCIPQRVTPGRGLQRNASQTGHLERFRRVWNPRAQPFAITLFLLDCSSSMAGERLAEMAQGCIEAMTPLLRGGSRCGAITFASYSGILSEAFSNISEATAAIEGLRAGGSTNLSAALHLARTTFEALPAKLMILITDGCPDDPASAIREADEAKAAGFVIRCIGVQGADEAFLSRIAGGESRSQSSTVAVGDLRKTIVQTAALELPR